MTRPSHWEKTGLWVAVDAARADDADRRLLGEHGARLHGRGVRAQQDVFVKIEGVLRVAGGVVLGQVEQLKVIMVQLHLRPFDHGKAQAREDRDDLLQGRRKRVDVAHLDRLSGDGDVQRLLLQARLLLLLLQLRFLCRERGLDLLAQGVDLLADDGPLLRAELAHALEQRGQLALAAEHGNADLLDLRAVPGGKKLLLHAAPDLVQFLLHDGSSLSFFGFHGIKKGPASPLGRRGRQLQRGTTQIHRSLRANPLAHMHGLLRAVAGAPEPAPRRTSARPPLPVRFQPMADVLLWDFRRGAYCNSSQPTAPVIPHAPRLVKPVSPKRLDKRGNFAIL